MGTAGFLLLEVTVAHEVAETGDGRAPGEGARLSGWEVASLEGGRVSGFWDDCMEEPRDMETEESGEGGFKWLEDGIFLRDCADMKRSERDVVAKGSCRMRFANGVDSSKVIR